MNWEQALQMAPCGTKLVGFRGDNKYVNYDKPENRKNKTLYYVKYDWYGNDATNHSSGWFDEPEDCRKHYEKVRRKYHELAWAEVHKTVYGEDGRYPVHSEIVCEGGHYKTKQLDLFSSVIPEGK